MIENDEKWGLLNRQLLEYAVKYQWGLYRNARLDMALILRKEKKWFDALQTFLEVCYLDLNGPNNTYSDPDILSKFPAFEPQNAVLAPKVIEWIKEVQNKAIKSNEDIRDIFLEHNSKIEKSLKLPLSIEESWQILQKELN